MRTLSLRCGRPPEKSTVVVRKNVFSAVLAPMRERLLSGGGILFTDSNVFAIYRAKIETCLGGVPVYVMPAGEERKNEETLFGLLRAMAEAKLRRNSVLVALGGGVVGDVGGLAAALYMRGIACIQVPTTLLSQVDSSVGGKTAVDFCGAKNLVGVFKQPEFVYADPTFLRTLPAREISCGLGEIVKHGALSPSLFERLCAKREELRDLSFLSDLVFENIAFKAGVVRRDPTERGERKCLNLGHTTAHALELGGAGLSHGECVALGLVFEGKIAQKTRSADDAFCERLYELCLRALGKLPDKIDVKKAARLALLDKKNAESGTVVCTAPIAAGKYDLISLPYPEYEALLWEIGEELWRG